MTDALTCRWASDSCTPPVELHRVQVGDGPLNEVLLCTFHGQYWPKVGEDREETERRTQRARSRMTSSARRQENAVRQAASRARGRTRQQTQDVTLPDEET